MKVFFDTDNIGMITDMLDAEEHSHYPIQLFLSIDEPLKITIAGNAAGVLACAHLACLLKKPRLREAFMAFPAGVLACAHLARREKRTDLSVLYGACSAVLTYTNLKKRTSTVRF